MLDLYKLQHFVVVARTGSFRQAAEQLHLSQPALSRSIQALERRYGVTLLDRSRTGVHLTTVGQQLLARAHQIGEDVLQTRLLTIEEQQHVLPPLFLIFLISWLAVLFLSCGLCAPRNFTVIALLLICALSVSSAIFLVLEMDRPLDGVIKASDAPLRKALELIDK